jgi:hypothetical protein
MSTQAYELSIASAMASAQAALEKEAYESNRTVEELKAQLHTQGLYSEYMQYFLQAAAVTENIENAAQLLEIERKLHEQGYSVPTPGRSPVKSGVGTSTRGGNGALRSSENSLNISQSLIASEISQLHLSIASAGAVDDDFAHHGADVLASVDDLIDNMRAAVADDISLSRAQRDKSSVTLKMAIELRRDLATRMEEQVKALKSRLQSIKSRRSQVLSVLQRHHVTIHRYFFVPNLQFTRFNITIPAIASSSRNEEESKSLGSIDIRGGD